MTSTSHQIYNIQISDREYKSWSFVHPETNAVKTPTTSESLINPATLKLFAGDLVDLSTPIPTVLYSPTKSKPIPGVLILAENKTYGRTTNQKRLLYKCVPNDPHLPPFLVPYQPDIKFTKTQKNRYVVFRFDNWNSKYPQGILTENLGDVDQLPSFYEYQIFCRNIQSNIAEFTAAAKKSIKSLPDIRARNPDFFRDSSPTNRTFRVFSIDPEGAKDFDDAFSVFQDSPFTVKIRVYIANVYAWMESLNMWSAFGDRVSTIYLPDSKRPMLPNILSDSVCSLVADNTPKPVFCMELRVRVSSSLSENLVAGSSSFDEYFPARQNAPLIIPGSVRVFNQAVKIDKNYTYESKSLFADPDYQTLLRCTRLLDPDIRDSHDVVSYWMIRMNSICGEWLNAKGVGIFREVSLNKMEDPEPPFAELPANTKTLLRNWKNVTGKYVWCDQVEPITPFRIEDAQSAAQSSLITSHKVGVLNEKRCKHEMMQIDSYVHITSPIRRLVDLLNQIIFQREFGLVEIVSREAEEFLTGWQLRMDELNVTMRSIRKAQIDCDLLYRCNAHPEWMQHPHRGVIFDRIEKPDGNYSYTVHLSDLNILGRIVTQEKYVNYHLLTFRLFVFHESDTLNRKIRLAVVN